MPKQKELYEVLRLSTNATNAEIKSAYRKQALLYHPDKNPSLEAAEHFKKINEAFTILNSPTKKKNYDANGIEGLRNRKPPTAFDSNEVFKNFFGNDNPFDQVNFSDVPDFNSRKKSTDKTSVDHHFDLTCSLQDLYCCNEKVLKVTRNRLSGLTNELMIEEVLLTVQLKPGYKEGTMICLSKEGDQTTNEDFLDIVLTVREVMDNECCFSRAKDNTFDLIYVHDITLLEALTDCIVLVPCMNGETVRLTCPEVIHPNYERRLVGKGMPRNHEKMYLRGDVIVRFRILFPKVISSDMKRILTSLEWTNEKPRT